jgi:hypothetical protein
MILTSGTASSIGGAGFSVKGGRRRWRRHHRRQFKRPPRSRRTTLRTLQRNRAELELAAEHIDPAHWYFEVLQVQQRLAVELRHAELVQVDAACDREHGGAGVGPHERHRQLAVEEPGLHTEGEVQRHVLHVARDVELLDVDVHRRLEGVLERLGPALQREGRLIHACRKGRLHVVFYPVGQVGEEGDGDVDLTHCVARVLGTVVDLDAAVDDLHVVEREARLLGGSSLGGTCGRELLDQVGEVVGAPVRVAHDVHVRIGELHLAQDWRAPKQRLGLEVQPQFTEAREHFGGAGLLDAESVHHGDHAEGIHVDVLDSDLALEQLAQSLDQVVLRHRWHDEKPDRCEQDEDDRDSEDGSPEQQTTVRWWPRRRRA